jgi:hypothetical protein
MSDDTTNRRAFLKGAGVAGVAGLAGCTGGNGSGGSGGSDGSGGSGGSDGSDGSGGSGGSGGSDGSGGSGDDGTATSGGQMKTVSLNVPAYGYWTVMMKEMERQGVLRENMESAGYDFELQYTWSGAPLFAAGKADIVHISPLECARLGPEQGINTVVSGRIASEFEGFWTRPGTDYDPDEVGSIQTAVDNMIKDQATLAHGSWAGGNIPPGKIFMDQYGQDFSEGGDFKIVTASYTAIPRLLADEQIDVALTSPMHGGGRFVLGDAMKPIAQFPPWFAGNTGFVPPLVNVATSQSFMDSDRAAVQAMVDTWKQGAEYLYESGPDAIQDDTDIGHLGCKSMEGARYVINYGLGVDDAPYSVDYPVVFEDTYIDDEYISGQQNFLSTIEERGLVPSGWQDYVAFEKMG